MRPYNTARASISIRHRSMDRWTQSQARSREFVDRCLRNLIATYTKGSAEERRGMAMEGRYMLMETTMSATGRITRRMAGAKRYTLRQARLRRETGRRASSKDSDTIKY